MVVREGERRIRRWRRGNERVWCEVIERNRKREGKNTHVETKIK